MSPITVPAIDNPNWMLFVLSSLNAVTIPAIPKANPMNESHQKANIDTIENTSDKIANTILTSHLYQAV